MHSFTAASNLSQIVRTLAAAGILVIAATPSDAQSFKIEKGTTYPGGTYKRFAPGSGALAACEKACASDVKCIAFTYDRPDKKIPQGQCSLKSQIVQRRPAECCTSGLKQAASRPDQRGKHPGFPVGDALPRGALAGKIATGVPASASRDPMFVRGIEAPFAKAMLHLPGARTAREVHYQLVDGVAVMEGDIVLGRPQDFARRFKPPQPPLVVQPLPPRQGDIGGRSDPLVATNRLEFLWGGGVIPYTIDRAFSASETASIVSAITTLNGYGTPVQLRPRNGERDFIRLKKVTNKPYCGMSPLGRQGGPQDIEIDQSCVGTPGVIMHEILHSAGVYHEHTRADRDRFIQINWSNIERRFRPQFLGSGETMDIGPYDFNSVMHYGGFAFAKQDGNGNALPTIVRRDGQPVIANRAGLSASDIAALRLLYANPGDAPLPVNQTRLLSVTIEGLLARSTDSCNGKMDFYAIVEVGAGWTWRVNESGPRSRRKFPVVQGNNIRPNWTLSGNVPALIDNAKVTIRVMDNDDLVCGGDDDVVDVNPDTNRTHLELLVNTVTGQVWRDSPDHPVGWLGDSFLFAGSHGRENAAILVRLGLR